MANYSENPPIGIDLGTTNSVLTYYAKIRNKSNIVEAYIFNTTGNTDNNQLFPSYVLYENDSTLKAGLPAYNNRISKPDRVAKAIKREIGTNDKLFTLNNESFTPKKLLSVIAKDIFIDPVFQEHKFKPSGIVVTVPYYFGQQQNVEILEAVENALFERYGEDKPEVMSVIPEPVAVALAYVHKNISNIVGNRKGVVFDLGGGTLDITFFSLEITMTSIHFEVIGSTGISKMGGEDFDEEIERLIIDEEALDFSNLSAQKQLIQKRKMRDEVIKAKEYLSSTNGSAAEIIFSKLNDGGAVDFTLSRTDFEKLLLGQKGSRRNYISEIDSCIRSYLTELKLNPSEFDLLLCVGGSSLIPKIQSLLQGIFPKATIPVTDDLVLYGVGKGAALYAAFLLDEKYNQGHNPFNRELKNIEIVYRTIHNLGVELHDGRMEIVLPKGSKIPNRKEAILFPTIANSNNGKASVGVVNILQGDKENPQAIGEINIPDIYLHGREINKNQVPIKISYQYQDTILKVNVFVHQGNEDKTDINISEIVRLKV